MPSSLKPARPRVLIVDDNAATLVLVGRMLDAIGQDYDIARDGFEAVTRLQTQAYSVLLLDYALPGMNGAQVLAWAKRNLASMPDVLVHSSEPDARLKRYFSGLPVRRFLAKPVSPADLVAEIRAVIASA